MQTKKLFFTLLIAALALGDLFFGVEYFIQIKEIQDLQAQLKTRQTNGKVVSFLSLFIEKVLKTDKEISFEDRLKLESAIRDVNDPELLSAWEQFTSGSTTEEIQRRVKSLLEVAVQKIAH